MNDDLEFINEKIKNEPVSLPESLSGAAVAQLVSGEAQAKPKKRRYRTVIVSLAAALAILSKGERHYQKCYERLASGQWQEVGA